MACTFGAGGIDSVLHAQNIHEKGTQRGGLPHLMILRSSWGGFRECGLFRPSFSLLLLLMCLLPGYVNVVN